MLCNMRVNNDLYYVDIIMYIDTTLVKSEKTIKSNCLFKCKIAVKSLHLNRIFLKIIFKLRESFVSYLFIVCLVHNFLIHSF